VERRIRAGGGPWSAWWQWGRVPGLAAGLLLIEWQLVGVVGTPIDQLRMLRQLVRAPADPLAPVAPVIAVLALMAEALVGYLLLLLVLRSLSLLPGSIGRLTGRAVLLVSPGMLQRLLDVLVGGALLAQATLVTTPAISAGPGLHAVQHRTASASPLWSAPPGAAHRSGPIVAEPLAPGFDPPAPAIGPPVAASPAAGVPAGEAPVGEAPGGGAPVGEARPVEARPTPSRLAAPLPPGSGAGRPTRRTGTR
jgi:hypothetical protein